MPRTWIHDVKRPHYLGATIPPLSFDAKRFNLAIAVAYRAIPIGSEAFSTALIDGRINTRN